MDKCGQVTGVYAPLQIGFYHGSHNLYLRQRITLSMLRYCVTIEFMGRLALPCGKLFPRFERIRWPVDQFFDRCLKRMVSKTGEPISSLKPQHPPQTLLDHNHMSQTLTASPPLMTICIYRGMDRLEAPLTQVVREAIAGLLNSPPFMILLARAIDASPSDIAAAASKLSTLFQKHSPLFLSPRPFGKASKYGKTKFSASGISIQISDSLIMAVESTPTSADNAPFLATLAVATITHQLAHWARGHLKLPITPPTLHVSRFCSTVTEDTGARTIHGESGYILETAVWGGVITALFQQKEGTEDPGNFSAMSALCVEAGPVWTVEQYVDDSGPPPTEYLLESHRLAEVLRQLGEGEGFSFPLFCVADLSVVGEEHSGYHRLRAHCDGEERTKPKMLFGVRRPSSCWDGKERDPDTFSVLV
ncbi:hypothetical protein DFH08DRAFT_849842 [Mycena albidolilacea]|uniref:Uncharacterized protein n=1 Tax=Mycena albidolilacea TaxID=1033008 RepID=A0AAD7EYA7_9AGAR|nr:hypothetical protein DFH08DRAFT_849842 [Mycena albidolilacea]